MRQIFAFFEIRFLSLALGLKLYLQSFNQRYKSRCDRARCADPLSGYFIEIPQFQLQLMADVTEIILTNGAESLSGSQGEDTGESLQVHPRNLTAIYLVVLKCTFINIVQCAAFCKCCIEVVATLRTSGTCNKFELCYFLSEISHQK